MKVLITGSQGQLGRCLQDRSPAFGFDVVAVDVDQLDIADSSAVSLFVRHCKPDVVINAAAYTAVDKAEVEQEVAYKVNATGPGNLASACAELDIPIIHISTDYVFDGRGIAPYHPQSSTAPQSIYGETKLAGEAQVVAMNPKHVIVRTAWVFSEYGNNFVKTIVRLANERDILTIVADQYGCPTYAGDLADALLKMVAKIEQGSGETVYGTHHFCGEEATSWHGFARAILAQAAQCGLLHKQPQLSAIATADYPTPAVRPEYSVMDCSGFPIPDVERMWQKSLHIVLEKLQSHSV